MKIEEDTQIVLIEDVPHRVFGEVCLRSFASAFRWQPVLSPVRIEKGRAVPRNASAIAACRSFSRQHDHLEVHRRQVMEVWNDLKPTLHAVGALDYLVPRQSRYEDVHERAVYWSLCREPA
jgi:hypothetical protein